MESNEITLPYVISVVVALAAVISPILTAIINNHHQAKLKKLEIEERNKHDVILHQREIFEKYLQYAGRCIYNKNKENVADVQNYGEYYHLALLLAKPELRNQMISTNDFIHEFGWGSARVDFEKLLPLVNNTLETLSEECKSQSRKPRKPSKHQVAASS